MLPFEMDMNNFDLLRISVNIYTVGANNPDWVYLPPYGDSLT